LPDNERSQQPLAASDGEAQGYHCRPHDEKYHFRRANAFDLEYFLGRRQVLDFKRRTAYADLIRLGNGDLRVVFGFHNTILP
jgi:hypothetical protein